MTPPLASSRGSSREAGSRLATWRVRSLMTASTFRVDGRRYPASRLAHLWITDEWPQDQINPRDGDAANIRWTNLRPVTHSQKLCNRGKQQNNSVGLKGVTFNK